MTVRCVSCGAHIEDVAARSESDQHCAACGGTRRQYEIELHAQTASFAASLAGNARSADHRKPFYEFLTGASWWRKAAKWVQRCMVIDRRNDRYFEQIIDP